MDDSFFKPMGSDIETAKELSDCFRRHRANDLLYVARFKNYKGQLKFLQQADPSLLEGFTMHFYSSGKVEGEEAEAYLKAVEGTALTKGINIHVHFRVPKATLMAHACRAAGQILWCAPAALLGSPR